MTLERSGDSNGQVMLGVVTVTYNSQAVLGDFVRSLLAQTHTSFRLYALDNASSDGSADALEQLGQPRFTIVRNEHNVGFAAATNQGIQMALRDGCTHVLMLNNDTAFPADLFEKLLEAARHHRIVAPKIFLHDKPHVLWFAGGRIARWRGYGLVHIGLDEVDERQYDMAHEIEAASGCCMLIETSVFSRVGLLDSRYFAYCEDVDFCLRAHRAGIAIWYAPEAHLFHKVSSLSGGSGSPLVARLATRNRVYYVKKNFGELTLASFLVAYSLYLAGRFLVGRDSWERLRLRMKAVGEGLRLHGDGSSTSTHRATQ